MSTNNTLDDLGNIASIANNYQLERIKGDLQRLSRFTQDAAMHQENQRSLRQQIFEIRNLLPKRLAIIKDDVVKYIYLLRIKSVLASNGLSTASFDEIHDKQYFSDTLDLVNDEIKKLDSCSSLAYETLEAINFINYRISGIKKLMSINFKELTNVKIDKGVFLIVTMLISLLGFMLSMPLIMILGNYSLETRGENMPIYLMFISGLLIGVITAIFVLPKIFLKNALKSKIDNYVLMFENCDFIGTYFNNDIIGELKNYKGEESVSKIVNIIERLAVSSKANLDSYYREYPELKNI